MQSAIEKQVMASVGVVYATRQLISATALKLYVLGASLVALWQLTWVHKVFANWEHVGLMHTGEYLSYAVMHTHLATQVALAGAVAAGLWLAADATRSLLATPRLSLSSPQ